MLGSKQISVSDDAQKHLKVGLSPSKKNFLFALMEDL